ncbi:MAG: glycoside hydrolase family 3 protein [Thermodesulfobacteriota bacterium]
MNKLELGELTVSEKIGQIVMPRLDFRDSDPLPHAKELVNKFQVGGFIVFSGERRQLKEATEDLQRNSKVPLFFACDAERGVGQIVSGETRFPFTMALGAIGDEDLVYRQARFIAKEMKDCGLNLLFAPVLDVNTNPENPIIDVRSYSDDPFHVSRLGAAFINGCQDEGVMACAKHFPGHGGVEIDSHVTLPSSPQSRDEFWKCDLVPFKTAIESDVASIMIAHLAVPGIDSNGVPATISPEVIQSLLIRDLCFKGLVITDSFHMGAITELGKEEEVTRFAILAGSDIILDPRQPENLLERLVEMVKTKEIPEHLLDSVVKKIIAVKSKWLKVQPYEEIVDETYGEKLLCEIARSSVCCLRGGRLRSENVIVYVLDVTQAKEDVSKPFLQLLAEAGINCEKKSVTPRDAETFLHDNRSGNQAIICLVYTSVAAWKGDTNLPESFKGFLKQVSDLHCEKILISFGSPYVVRGFENFDTILCTFDSLDVCQQSVVEILLGELEAQGKLPVKL